MVYSDLSFILLGIIVERVSGRPLDVYAKETFENMGLKNSTYLPAK
jgi:CubicO group peptidase (beta-lactamase class C family)